MNSSFDMAHIADGRKWLEWNLRARNQLTLIATTGYTFGHHHRNGVQRLDIVRDASRLRGGHADRIFAIRRPRLNRSQRALRVEL